MKSAFALCFLKIMQIKFSAYFTENNMMHIQDTTVIILPWCKSTFLFFQNAFPMKIWYHIISTMGKKYAVLSLCKYSSGKKGG